MDDCLRDQLKSNIDIEKSVVTVQSCFYSLTDLHQLHEHFTVKCCMLVQGSYSLLQNPPDLFAETV